MFWSISDCLCILTRRNGCTHIKYYCQNRCADSGYYTSDRHFFFTFQALSYVIDVYRREVEVQRSWFTIALYVSFFSKLIAGPIVKYKDINRQLTDRLIRKKQPLEYGVSPTDWAKRF